MKELIVHPALALRSDRDVRSVLELLSLHFWSIKEREARARTGEHWIERQRAAEELFNLSQKAIDAARNLIYEEAWIESRAEICGTGRHTPEVVGTNSKDHIRGLQGLIENFITVRPTLEKLKHKRKPRIDDDENFFLYLMAAILKFRGEACEAAIRREITTFVEAWRLSKYRNRKALDVKDIQRRMDRFFSRNETFAKAIDSDPVKYVVHVYDVISREGLRRA